MKSKVTFIITSAIILSAFLVAAVTLTKDATEKVIITKAYKISVEDSENLGSDKILVFGYADIYAKDAPDQVAARLAIFIYDNVLYRATNFGPVYEQTNNRIIGENGGGSIVNHDGTEKNGAFIYSLGFDESGNTNELVFKFSREEGGTTYKDGGRVLKLKEVLKVVDEEIEWRPE